MGYHGIGRIRDEILAFGLPVSRCVSAAVGSVSLTTLSSALGLMKSISESSLATILMDSFSLTFTHLLENCYSLLLVREIRVLYMCCVR